MDLESIRKIGGKVLVLEHYQTQLTIICIIWWSTQTWSWEWKKIAWKNHETESYDIILMDRRCRKWMDSAFTEHIRAKTF
jgi:hypothetical protein